MLPTPTHTHSYLDSTYAADIEAGGFVNDVAFQQGTDAGAYGTVLVSSASGCSCVAWRQKELLEFLKSRPEMHRNLNHVLVAKLVKGLLKQREAAHATERSWVRKLTGVAKLPQPAAPAARQLRMSHSERHLYDDRRGAGASASASSSWKVPLNAVLGGRAVLLE